MNFDYLNKEQRKFNITVAKQIVFDIEERIRKDVALFHNYIDQDNKKFLEKFQFSKLLDAMDRINKESWIMEENKKTKIYCGIGNIGVCHKCNADVVLYFILKALKTNNNIIFFEENEIHKTTQSLIDIANEECKKNKYSVNFEVVKYNKISEISSNVNNFNMFIFVNELDKYLDFIARNQNDMKIICSNYGTMDLFLDQKDLKDTLLQIDDYVYKNNIELELYKNESVIDVVKEINVSRNNYCAVIFTKSKEDAYYFIENVKAEKVFVNKNPAIEYEFELSDEEVTICKSIYI